MKIIYADCFSGISGDMLLGALINCGMDQQVLHSELDKLSLGDFEFLVEQKTDQSISGCKVTICSKRRQELRTLPAIMEILDQSGLDDVITTRSAAVFKVLASNWKLMVTSSPPKRIPQATLSGKKTNPRILEEAHKIQLPRVTNRMIRCWIPKMPTLLKYLCVV